MPPVKRYALEQGVTVCQPAGFRGAEAREQLSAFRPDVHRRGRLRQAAAQTCAGHRARRLPEPASVAAAEVPRAAPVATAIRDGLAATGVTLMLLDEGMDTGPIVAQREFPISPTDTAGSLTAGLFQAGADLLMDNIRAWVNGDIYLPKTTAPGAR